MSFAPGDGSSTRWDDRVQGAARAGEMPPREYFFTNNSNILYKKNIFSAKNVLLICSKISYKKYKI